MLRLEILFAYDKQIVDLPLPSSIIVSNNTQYRLCVFMHLLPVCIFVCVCVYVLSIIVSAHFHYKFQKQMNRKGNW